MKKIYVLLIAFITLSCSVDDGNKTHVSYESLPIEGVIIPEEFQLNKKHKITLNYLMPTDCHGFSNIYFEKNGATITTAIIAVKHITEENTCDTINIEYEASFDLLASQTEKYLFKFWQGKDDEGEDTYMEMEVPVVNN